MYCQPKSFLNASSRHDLSKPRITRNGTLIRLGLLDELTSTQESNSVIGNAIVVLISVFFGYILGIARNNND